MLDMAMKRQNYSRFFMNTNKWGKWGFKQNIIKHTLTEKAGNYKLKEMSLSMMRKMSRENINTIPNYLTLSRILLSPAIGYFIVNGEYGYALGSLVYAGASDMLDGLIARKFNSKTALGSILDPLADKILMTTLTVSLSLTHTISPIVGGIIIARDFGLIGAGAYFRWKTLPQPKTPLRYFDPSLATVRLKPTLFSKVNTALQLLLMGSAVTSLVYPDLFVYHDKQILDYLQLIVATSTVGSGLEYMMKSRKSVVKILEVMGHAGHNHERTSDQRFHAPITKVETVNQVKFHSFPHLTKRQISTVAKNGSDASEYSPIPDLDHFRLSFEAYGTRFNLHLEPNSQLLHPDARVNVYGKEGKLVRSQKLGQFPARFYTGRVLAESESQNVFDHGFDSPFSRASVSDLGWARITVYDFENDGQPLIYKRSSIPSFSSSDDDDDELVKFEGAFTYHGELYHLKLTKTYKLVKRSFDAHPTSDEATLLIYRESDQVIPKSSTLKSNPSFCGADEKSKNPLILQQEQDRRAKNMPVLRKRADTGCPTATKILYMGVAADCSYVSNYGGEAASLQQILSDWNQASQLYESTFNIQLGVITVSLHSACGGGITWNQDCSTGYTIDQRLSDFSQWRGATQNADAGLWHLMSSCSTGATIGVTWLGQLCVTTAIQSDGDYVSGTGLSTVNPNEWMVVSHEIGHSFGSPHDCTADTCNVADSQYGQCCPCTPQCDCNAEYIMNPTSDVKTATFSPCTQQKICNTVASSGSCLADPGQQSLISANICGNGVKEGNEQCDCGPADSAECQADPCCDGSTCTLTAGSQCDDNNDLCCKSCQIEPAQTVCRPSKGDCDIAEVCNGVSGDCPTDKYLPDLQTCVINSTLQGTCASGDCTTRNLQCQQKGVAAGITGECPGYTDQCSMFCAGPSAGTCIQISGYFENGTPCSYKGKCENGACQTTGINGLIGWFMAHLAIAIAVLVFLIILVLCCLYKCISVCFKTKRPGATGSNLAARPQTLVQARRPSSRKPAEGYPAHIFLAPSEVPASAPQMQQNSRWNEPPRPSGWVDPKLYNGDIAKDDVDLAALTEVPVNAALTNYDASGNNNRNSAYLGSNTRDIDRTAATLKRASTPPMMKINTESSKDPPTMLLESPRKAGPRSPRKRLAASTSRKANIRSSARDEEPPQPPAKD